MPKRARAITPNKNTNKIQHQQQQKTKSHIVQQSILYKLLKRKQFFHKQTNLFFLEILRFSHLIAKYDKNQKKNNKHLYKIERETKKKKKCTRVI